MALLPRTDDFAPLIGAIPSDGALWVPGEVSTADPAADELGEPARYSASDYGVHATDPEVPAASWWVCRTAPAYSNLRLVGRLHWRHVEGERQEVRLGLLARWQGDSAAQAGPPEHWLGGSCYALEGVVDPDAETVAWTLSRYNAGVASTLDTATSDWPAGRTYDVELRVVTADSGAVRVRGFVAGAEIVDVTDPLLTALAGGRVGFLTSDGSAAAGRTRSGIRSLSVLRVGSDAVQFLEDFQRPNRVDEDPAYHLRSLWAPLEGLQMAAGELKPLTGGEGDGRICTYQVHPTTADYRVTAVVQFVDTADHWAGVVVRASKAATDPDLEGFTGYLVRLTIGEATENLQLLKVVGGKMVDSSKATVAGLVPGTPLEIRVDVSGDLDVRVVVRLNRLRLITYTDSLSDRHTRAGQAGVYLLSATSTPGVAVQSFTLKDAEPTSTAVVVRRFGDELVGVADVPLVMADLSSQIVAGRTTFRLPVVPAGAAQTATYWNGLRVRSVTEDPTGLQCTVDASVPSLITAFEPKVGDSLLVDVLPSGSTGVVVGEVPSGTVNGTNKSFTLAASPLFPAGVRVYVGGLRMRYAGTTSTPAAGEYSIPSGTSLKVGTAPVPGGQFCVDYVTGAVPIVFGETPSGVLDGVNRVFTLAAAPNSAVEVAPCIAGLRSSPGSGALQPTQYSLSGDELTLGINAPSTAWLVADYVEQGEYEEVLNLVPDSPVTVGREYLTDIARSELGYEWTVPLMAGPRATYPLKATALTEAQRDYVVDFFDRHVGPYRHFLWLPPDEDELQTVHLASNTFRETKHAPDVYSLELTLEQLTVKD